MLRCMSGVSKSKKRLAKAGWRVGTAAEFLHLTPEEELYVELKASLSQQLRRRREKSHLTQTELARMLKSSQSRVAKMEKGDPSVSIDLLIKSLLALGTTRREIARAIA
jgi:DNA-binding XRE family transcriptional regulator